MKEYSIFYCNKYLDTVGARSKSEALRKIRDKINFLAIEKPQFVSCGYQHGTEGLVKTKGKRK